MQGVAAALPHVAKGVPVAAIGYSRGGRLVMDYASVSSVTGLVPGRILSVFPSGIMDPLMNLAPLAGHTKVLILAGDKDTTVGTVGAGQLVTQLAASGFPYSGVRFELVHSHGTFVADHLSVLNDTPRPAAPTGGGRTGSSRRSPCSVLERLGHVADCSRGVRALLLELVVQLVELRLARRAALGLTFRRLARTPFLERRIVDRAGARQLVGIDRVLAHEHRYPGDYSSTTTRAWRNWQTRRV